MPKFRISETGLAFRDTIVKAKDKDAALAAFNDNTHTAISVETFTYFDSGEAEVFEEED